MINNAGCPHGCNSLGQILFKGKWEPCPIHGPKGSSLLLDGKLPNGDNLFDILRIPLEYREYRDNKNKEMADCWVTNVSNMFTNTDITNNCIRDSVRQLREVMEDMYNVLAIEDNLYMNSLYFYANPNLLDLKPFAYTIQRVAFEKNMSVLPATTINNLCGLLALQGYASIPIRNESDISYISGFNRLAGEGADWYYRTKLTYSDYLRASVCVIFDNGGTLDENLPMFAGFLEERGQRDLPTYVFSTTYFDLTREKYLFDKWGNRKLSRLTPYLLIGKNQEATAREHGWLRSKGALEGGLNKPLDVNGYSLSGYKGKEEKVVNDFSDTL